MGTVRSWAVEVKRQFIDEQAWKLVLISIVIGFLIGFVLAMLGVM